MAIWEKIISNSGNSENKGPEAEGAWQYLRSARKASVHEAEPVSGGSERKPSC